MVAFGKMLREAAIFGVVAGLAGSGCFCVVAALARIIEADNVAYHQRDMGRRFFHDVRAQRLWDDRMERGNASLQWPSPW